MRLELGLPYVRKGSYLCEHQEMALKNSDMRDLVRWVGKIH